ncbi:YdcF family protein [Frankia sp. CNm7]|uniref:YdcF family protein n=2 Tax=Frankia nepalensis TaxID=1836974 RepID=A0A937RFG2_9ACTN|nr:YdcF family protein [Frankia nepalensis]MBL7509708.1 YdcF family protein [Frankia nepalensis]MBL7516944.1 YdcF family protein [Frankia nepalensis]MBL7629435.1 YdcF family protein [Frankia nepalensis]
MADGTHGAVDGTDGAVDQASDSINEASGTASGASGTADGASGTADGASGTVDGADSAVGARGAGSLLVFTGAATRGAAVAEAETMARYAREVLGVPPERIVLETEARTTRQNLAFTLPYLESAKTIKIVSDPVHAARARRYLRQLRPDLAARVVPADDYRPLERVPLKLGVVAYELTRPVLRHVMPPLRDWRRDRARRRA